jgi:hypothetical protein
MTAASPPLSFEFTRSEMLDRLRRNHARMQQSWPRRFAVATTLFCAIILTSAGNRLAFVCTFVVFTEFWLGWFSYGVGRLFAVRSARGPFELETDDRGILLRSTFQRTASQRFWWRGLKSVQDADGWVELDFGGGMLLSLPVRVFANSTERDEFVSLANSRLTARRDVAPAR